MTGHTRCQPSTDDAELLRQKLEFAEFEWNRATEGMQERDRRIEELEGALRTIAEWPPFSGVDDISNYAIAALEAKP